MHPRYNKRRQQQQQGYRVCGYLHVIIPLIRDRAGQNRAKVWESIATEPLPTPTHMSINVLTECLKWRRCSDKCGKARYVKHCLCAQPAIHKRFSFLIGSYDVVCYDVSWFPAFCWTKCHFRWSDKLDKMQCNTLHGSFYILYFIKLLYIKF